MKIVFFGNNERGCRCLEELVSHYPVELVITLPLKDQPNWSRSLIKVSEELRIPSIQTSDTLHTPVVEDIVRDCKPDIIILAGWPKLISEEIIDSAAIMCMNLHAGPVPSYRGASVINWQIINGERVIGISILQVTPGIDSGPVLMSRTFPISVDDTYTDILNHILDVYPSMLIETIDNIDRIDPAPQNNNLANIYTKRYPKDGHINWNKSAWEVHNLIRALTLPMPGAFTYNAGKPIIIEKSKLIRITYRGTPGRIAARWAEGVVVNCADRGLLLRRYRDGDEVFPMSTYSLTDEEMK